MRRIAIALVIALIWILASTIPVAGASITVNASCSLPDAITAANTDTATGGCIAGTAGSDTINITQAGASSGTITLSATLAVNGTNSQESIIVLDGGGFTVSGNDSVRAFLVQEHGNLSISNLTISNGSAANGGGVRVESGGVLTLNSVVIKDSEATSNTGGGLRNRARSPCPTARCTAIRPLLMAAALICAGRSTLPPASSATTVPRRASSAVAYT